MKRRVLCLLPLPAMAVDTDLKYYMAELNSTSDTHRDSHPVGTYHGMYNDYITLIVFPNGNASIPFDDAPEQNPQLTPATKLSRQKQIDRQYNPLHFTDNSIVICK